VRTLLLSLLIGFALPAWAENDAPAHEGLIKWSAWSEQAFKKALDEKKPMVLDLEAVWCHTYGCGISRVAESGRFRLCEPTLFCACLPARKIERSNRGLEVGLPSP